MTGDRRTAGPLRSRVDDFGQRLDTCKAYECPYFAKAFGKNDPLQPSSVRSRNGNLTGPEVNGARNARRVNKCLVLRRLQIARFQNYAGFTNLDRFPELFVRELAKCIQLPGDSKGGNVSRVFGLAQQTPMALDQLSEPITFGR